MSGSYQSTMSGWREWVSLPDIGVPDIEAKIDTGTEASVLYVSFLEHYRRDNDLWVRFCVDPIMNKECSRVVCQVPVKSTEALQSPEQHNESFFVIEATIKIGNLQTRQNIVLKNQRDKQYMLQVGRNALKDLNIHVNPNCSYVLGSHQTENLKPAPVQA